MGKKKLEQCAFQKWRILVPVSAIRNTCSEVNRNNRQKHLCKADFCIPAFHKVFQVITSNNKKAAVFS